LGLGNSEVGSRGYVRFAAHAMRKKRARDAEGLDHALDRNEYRRMDSVAGDDSQNFVGKRCRQRWWVEGAVVREGAQWHGRWLQAGVGETGGDVADLCIQELLDRAEEMLRVGSDVLSIVCQRKSVSCADAESADQTRRDAGLRDEDEDGTVLAEMRRHLSGISLLRGHDHGSLGVDEKTMSKTSAQGRRDDAAATKKRAWTGEGDDETELLEGVKTGAGDAASAAADSDLESRAREVLDDIWSKGVGWRMGSRTTGLGVDAQLLCLVGVHRSRRREGSHVENMDTALAYFLSALLLLLRSNAPSVKIAAVELLIARACEDPSLMALSAAEIQQWTGESTCPLLCPCMKPLSLFLLNQRF
jgi:hypothetical protein